MFMMVYHNISYSELLTTKNERTIHQQNINVLMKEIHKFENNLSPPLIDDMFQVCKTNSRLKMLRLYQHSRKR